MCALPAGLGGQLFRFLRRLPHVTMVLINEDRTSKLCPRCWTQLQVGCPALQSCDVAAPRLLPDHATRSLLLTAVFPPSQLLLVYGAGRPWRVKQCVNPCCGCVSNRDVGACVNMTNLLLWFAWAVTQGLVDVVGERPQPFERAHHDGVAAVQHASRARQAALSQAGPQPHPVSQGMRLWQRALQDWEAALARLRSSLLELEQALGAGQQPAAAPGQRAAEHEPQLAAQLARQEAATAQQDVLTAWQRACEQMPVDADRLLAEEAMQRVSADWSVPASSCERAQQAEAHLQAMQTQQRAAQSTEASRRAREARQQAQQQQQQQADEDWVAWQSGAAGEEAMQVRAVAEKARSARCAGAGAGRPPPPPPPPARQPPPLLLAHTALACPRPGRRWTRAARSRHHDSGGAGCGSRTWMRT